MILRAEIHLLESGVLNALEAGAQLLNNVRRVFSSVQNGRGRQVV